ncbi:MAG: DNA-3-methyladenine glycosylase [Candidatus Microsaccharimonas sp.]
MPELASAENFQKAANHLQTHDHILGAVIASAPLPTFVPHKNYYQELVESIVSQQLSVKAAATILKRFKELFTSEFPTPEDILATDIEEMRAVGLSRQKASYIKDLAARVLDGSVQFSHLDSLTNQEIIDELVQIKGVGVWTVHMFLLFCMGRLDVLPTGDLGIKNGIQKLYALPEKPSPEDIQTIASDNHWHPYESIASWYVWHSLDNKPAL